MASTLDVQPRPRPAHTQGSTHCAYTPDGTKLVTVGSNNTIRIYKTGFDGEPTNIDGCPEDNTAVATSNDFFVAGSEDGHVSLYSLNTYSFKEYVTRCSLPIRDIALSADSKWCAVASDELTIKVVNTENTDEVHILREHNRPTKHVSFDPKGSTLALSCSDGVVYMYSMTAEQPELIRKVGSLIPALETDAEVSSQVAWHPDGRAFAVPIATRDIQVVSKNDWENQRAFSSGHDGDITTLAWSPNGALLASAGRDSKLLIWATKDQSVVARYEFPGVMDFAWHPTKNLVSFTTSDGYVYICEGFIPEQFASVLQLPKQRSPFIHDPLDEISANARRPAGANGHKSDRSRPRRDSLASLDDLLDELDGDDDGFVVDEDGAGYSATADRKRHALDDDIYDGHVSKRTALMRPQYHDAFQPGSTPWRGNRKYLCLNLIGFVWTVDQDSHNTVTVEFHDHEFHRDFHFTDTLLYDKACLNEQGALFACPPKGEATACIFYRPHETWTRRSDWRTRLPKGEAVLAMSLSDSFITVTTTANYIRVYTLFGIPFRVTRPKNTPMVTCASWKDYVLTVGNGSVGGDGRNKLVYTIENLKRDEICQNEDTVALPDGATLQGVFFSEKGDPCIYDSTGTLLTLLHWRSPSRASWVPLLDTKLMPRLASGRKRETYFPIAVADNRFHCIILKGGDQYPYFPRPLLSEFDFAVPLTSAPESKKPKRKNKSSEPLDEDDGDKESDEEEEGQGEEDDEVREIRALEQSFLLRSIQTAQLSDLLDSDERGGRRLEQKGVLARLEIEIDKTLLQLLGVECRAGEARGMRALDVVRLMRDSSGRIMELAGRVAERYNQTVLGDKIREEGERRFLAAEDGDGHGDDEYD